MSSHPVTFGFSGVVATWLACRGLPLPCRAAGHFSLRGQREVTKRKATPFRAFRAFARKVRGRAPGFVDRASCPDDKLAGVPAGHPSGCSSTRPPRHRGPKVKSQNEERASPCRSAPRARPPFAPALEIKSRKPKLRREQCEVRGANAGQYTPMFSTADVESHGRSLWIGVLTT